MLVLALDTTTRGGSVALVDDDRVVGERPGDESRTHAERLPREITDLLSASGLRTGDIDVFAVASGPGSFTGLRIGIATIQGLAFVHGRPVVAVSALDALGHIGSVHARRAKALPVVAVWMDAHRGEVFSALYAINEAEPFTAERVTELEGASVGDPARTVQRWTERLTGRDVTFIGDGAALYADIVRDAASRVLPQPLLAAAIGQIARARARTGGSTSAAGIQPLYVRRPDAEIAREADRRLDARRHLPAGGRS
jgi:tRNA threonylcarbamoyladenosine biosynthesis protein TsaB